MRYIRAPFNFVPISNNVFFPDWSKQISHDVPFSDGLSGKLTIEIKAETSVFVRDSIDTNRFCHTIENNKPKFFIPATTFKGTVRSVFEILAFGKMDQINDHKYAIRDLHNPEVYNLMKDSPNIRCGWLKTVKDEKGIESAIIDDCGIPWRISHQQLDNQFGTDFVTKFMEGGTVIFKKNNISNRIAKFKYDFFDSKGLSYQHHFIPTNVVYNQQRCDFTAKGSIGKIVFTGQPGPRGKFYEFVFVEQSGADQIAVDAKIWSEFKFQYLDHDREHISPDWKWRKKELRNGGRIPVFFRIDKSKALQVKDLGLSYLYKMPYNFSVKDLLHEDQALGFFKPDLADCIFGYTEGEESLKGRVQFSPFKADMSTAHEGPLINTILGSPKASYYPIYIKQEGALGEVDRTAEGRPVYKTYMDSDAELAGRKRYPAQETEAQSNTMPQGTPTMGVKFTPLRAGAIFTGTINYSNLRRVELGALLSALTFHNNSTECYHGIGLAKSYGFGRVSLKIKDGIDQKALSEYLGEFESAINAYMQVEDPNFDWHKSQPVRQFISMSKIQRINDDRMKYMPLEEFPLAKNKDNGYYLDDYTSIVRDRKVIDPFPQSENFEELKNNAVYSRELLKEEISQFEKQKKLLKDEIERKELLKKQKELEDNYKEIEEIRLARLREIEKEDLARLELKNELERKKTEEANKLLLEEKLRKEEKIKNMIEDGLEPILQNVNDFGSATRRIDQYMEKIQVKQLNARDINLLSKKCADWFNSTPVKLIETNWKPEKGYNWKKLAIWIGKDLATKLCNDLISK